MPAAWASPGQRPDDNLVGYLVESGLAGPVATPTRASLENCRRLVNGEPDYTFGLSDWRHTTYEEALAAVRAAGGPRVVADAADSDHGCIDPDATMAGIRTHRRVLASLVAGGGGRVLLATGHPFALLAHYEALSRALAVAGCEVLRPLEGSGLSLRNGQGRPCGLRYLDGVASLFYEAALQHTHRPDYMEAMLEEVIGPGGVDLVIADHGFAGAAIEAGVPTISLADVNDPALPLAQARGRTDGVLMIDDGLDAWRFEPVTAAMLDWAVEDLPMRSGTAAGGEG